MSKYTLLNNSPTSYYYFKTYYKTNNPPTITSISPTSRVAGVGEILTINGSNFGTTSGKVYFRAADNGGQTYLNGLDNQYITASGCSWSNTQGGNAVFYHKREKVMETTPAFPAPF